MSNLRTNMTQDMIVRGLAKGTQKAYLLAVTELSDYYNQHNPATLSKQDFVFNASKKHMVQRRLGRLEPTPYLKYRADEVMRNMPTLST